MTTQLAQVREQVGQRLRTLCETEQARAALVHPAYARLWQTIGNQVASGGKYIRPYIITLTHESYGGTATIIDTAAAWELMHIGLLMHDDVIDRDFTRHGQPNVAGQYLDAYDSEHHAQSAGLLAGDLVLAMARRLLTRPAQVELFETALFTVIGGELLDLESGLMASPADPELIAEAKTASYSFIGPLLTGATMAGASEPQLELLRELGRVWGVGFQLADDLLIFSDDATAGKAVLSDLAEGKRTMVITEALKLLPKAERRKIELTMITTPSANATNLSQLLRQTNVLPVLRKKLTNYEAQAQTIINQLEISPEAQVTYNQLTHQLLFRNA